jgi:hypothetical protein
MQFPKRAHKRSFGPLIKSFAQDDYKLAVTNPKARGKASLSFNEINRRR